MKKFDLEIAVGLFVVLGFVCFAYLSVKLGDVNLFGNHKYQVKAYFGSVAGLKEGAPIKVAGVPVGNVKSIRLDEKFYEAEVALELEQKVKLPRDSIASVRTSGIIGDRYISISPGGSLENLSDGGEIKETESAINLENLISKYVFQSKKD